MKMPNLRSLEANLYRMKAWLHRRLLGMNKAATIDDVEILYKSNNYIVVDKHYDVKINSNDPQDEITLATQLAHRYPELVDASICHQFRFVHRLDYSTSGTLCVALNKRASANAMKKFKKREVNKCYYALVRGHVQPDFLMIDKPVCPNPEEGYTHMMRVADSDLHQGQSEVKILSAITELSVMQRGLYDGSPASKVLLKPITGRRHQLRVHCWSIGHPVVGDFTYSFRKDVKPYRMMLHSQRLAIPTKTEMIDITATDPFTPERDPKWCPEAPPQEVSLRQDTETPNERTLEMNRDSATDPFTSERDPKWCPEAPPQKVSLRQDTETPNERTLEMKKDSDGQSESDQLAR